MLVSVWPLPDPWTVDPFVGWNVSHYGRNWRVGLVYGVQPFWRPFLDAIPTGIGGCGEQV